MEDKLKTYVKHLVKKQNKQLQTVGSLLTNLCSLLHNCNTIDIIKYIGFMYLFCIFIDTYFHKFFK